jgi:hypothetical protein
MKTRSAKAKGRRASQEVKDTILAWFPELTDDDIVVTSSGVTGEDLVLSARARALVPFVFEVKNQEALQIWKALDQAKTHAEKRGDDSIPLLVFRRNRSILKAGLDFSALLHLVRQIHDLREAISRFDDVLKAS